MSLLKQSGADVHKCMNTVYVAKNVGSIKIGEKSSTCTKESSEYQPY